MRAIALAIVLASCRPVPRVGSPCAGDAAFAPFDGARDAAASELLPSGVLDQLVAWYQRGGRAAALPGIGCPFSPTCSAYARIALRRYGPFAIAWIVDRLIVREHALAAAYYPMTCVDHTTRLADDVP